jgi:hypothetical protein
VNIPALSELVPERQCPLSVAPTLPLSKRAVSHTGDHRFESGWGYFSDVLPGGSAVVLAAGGVAVRSDHPEQRRAETVLGLAGYETFGERAEGRSTFLCG